MLTENVDPASLDVNTKKIDKESSERLSILRFPLIIGVIFLHSGEAHVRLASGIVGIDSPGSIEQFIRDMISGSISRIAVPLFFLLSGYFFFLGFSFTKENYIRKLKSRAKTLFIPYIFWNLLTVSILATAQSLPLTQQYFSGRYIPIASFSNQDLITALFGIGRAPFAYHFWFIRDLMIMVLLVPIVGYLIKINPPVLLVGIVSIWFFDLWPINMPSAVAFSFFSIGAYFARHDTSLFVFDRSAPLLTVLYISILLFDVFTKGNSYNIYIHNFGILIGIVLILFLTQVITRQGNIKKRLLTISKFSFFVFAIHEPMLTITRKLVYRIAFFDFVNKSAISLLLYFSMPIFIASLAILAYLTLNKITPGFLKIITGGRS